MYDLKSTGRRNQNSSEDTTDRKDSPPENSVTHAPGHNVQRRDVSGEEAAKSGQNEAGEDHEFVVHLRDDLLPGGQRGDAVVARKQLDIYIYTYIHTLQSSPHHSPVLASPHSNTVLGVDISIVLASPHYNTVLASP